MGVNKYKNKKIIIKKSITIIKMLMISLTLTVYVR